MSCEATPAHASESFEWRIRQRSRGLTCVTPPDKSKIRNGGDIMLACSPRSHEVTLRASAYALSRASRRRRTALSVIRQLCADTANAFIQR